MKLPTWIKWKLWNHENYVVVNQVENYESSEKLFPPRWECFHRGGNVYTAVEMFPPRWKCFHRGGNYFQRGDNYFHLSIAFIVSPGCLDLVAVVVVVVDILCYFQHVAVVVVVVDILCYFQHVVVVVLVAVVVVVDILCYFQHVVVVVFVAVVVRCWYIMLFCKQTSCLVVSTCWYIRLHDVFAVVLSSSSPSSCLSKSGMHAKRLRNVC